MLCVRVSRNTLLVLNSLMMMVVEKKGGPLLLVFCHSESSSQAYSSYEWISIAEPVGFSAGYLGSQPGLGLGGEASKLVLSGTAAIEAVSYSIYI